MAPVVHPVTGELLLGSIAGTWVFPSPDGAAADGFYAQAVDAGS
ncbi:MAG: hypothetical protein R2715_20100 [Ilumatobacteraceae bacterium]